MAGRVNEANTALYTAQLVDENGADVSLSDISALTITLYDKLTGTILNGRDGQNALNANGVTVSLTGAVSWILQPADNVIVSTNLDSELHIALFQGVYGSGNKDVKHEFAFRVVNLNRVP